MLNKSVIINVLRLGLGLLSLSFIFNAFSLSNWQLTLSSGLGKLKIAGNQYISTEGCGIPAGFPDNFQTRNTTATLFDISISKKLGGHGLWLNHYAMGISYNFSTLTPVKGQLTEFNLPQFRDDYNYEYNVQHHALLATFQDDIYHDKQWFPYVQLGLGLSLNNASNFIATPNANAGAFPRDMQFDSKTITQPAYTIGLGIGYQLSTNIVLQLSYMYMNMGNVKLQTGSAGEAGLVQKLHYQADMLSLRYQA